MSELDELVETGFGALVLAFGVVAGATVYSSGSIGAVHGVFSRFTYALALAFLPTLSIAAWPNVVAGAAGVGSAAKLRGPVTFRATGFVASYVFLAIVLHYAVHA